MHTKPCLSLALTFRFLIYILRTTWGDEIAEFAKALAEHENFEKAKNKQQREFLAKSLFPQLVEYSEYTMFLVITIAEFHFNIHIKPIKAKELAQKINELKNQGMSKSKIAASIGASIDVINKFF